MSRNNIFITYIFLLYVCFVNGQFMKVNRKLEEVQREAARTIIGLEVPELKSHCQETAINWCAPKSPNRNAIVDCARSYYETTGWSCNVQFSMFPVNLNNPESTRKLGTTATRTSPVASKPTFEQNSDSDDDDEDYDC